MSVWLDNLIPLKAPRLEEHQLAGWQPKTVAMQGLGCRLLADQRVPVDGGVSLSADVYTPKRPGRYPAIVQFAAYSRELHTAGVPTGSNEIGSPPVLTDRGYAQVVVTRRGMGRSESEAGIFFNSQDVGSPERRRTRFPFAPGQSCDLGDRRASGATELTRLYTEAS